MKRLKKSWKPSLSEEEQITVGDEWAHYMEVEIKEEDLSLRVDHLWRKVFWWYRWQWGEVCGFTKDGEVCTCTLSFQCRC